MIHFYLDIPENFFRLISKTDSSLCIYPILLLLSLLLYSLPVFLTRDSWWFLTGIWVKASLLWSPGLYLVFWLILTMLLSRWSRFFLWLPILTVIFPSLFPSALTTIGTTVTFIFHNFFSSLARSKYFLIFYFYSEVSQNTLQIGSVAFPPGQCPSPQLHPCHRLFDQDGHQHSSLASLLSRPCSLWLLVIP